MTHKLETKCKLDECDKEVLAKEYCKTHYHYLRRHGKLLTKLSEKQCQVGRCNRSIYAKKLCFNHYRNQWLREQPLGCKCEQCKKHK